jgi:surface antigen
MTMKSLRLGALAFACIIGALAMGASSANAQISPFSGRGPKMDREDVALMDKAAAPLFQGETFTPGSTASWKNPNSGWSGTVTAKGTAKVSGLSCRVLDYQFDIPKRADERSYTAKWCRTKDGTWKLG